MGWGTVVKLQTQTLCCISDGTVVIGSDLRWEGSRFYFSHFFPSRSHLKTLGILRYLLGRGGKVDSDPALRSAGPIIAGSSPSAGALA
ncbi:hypothetical protein PoB_001837000 [Plakobranchus ocellatus]|uniref:Uncharacterized protein n=1 Tax=Plakobranchus ocellatus TaxID=259542 RepID=A0AAV3Z8L7_9GAST|nr:hypothetical protein PoB_001837000 [Plakobranchus ocellatus]